MLKVEVGRKHLHWRGTLGNTIFAFDLQRICIRVTILRMLNTWNNPVFDPRISLSQLPQSQACDPARASTQDKTAQSLNCWSPSLHRQAPQLQ